MQNDYGDILFLIVIAFCLIYVLLDMKFTFSKETKKDTKPIIRHCRNCKWHLRATMNDAYCDVKYKFISNGKKSARFCRYYKAEEGGKNE